MEDLLQVGVITQPHGIKGEVKVFPTTDDINRFKKLKNVILDTDKEKIELEISGVKFFKQYVILKFKGFDNINDIEKYKGKSLLVTRENAVKLKRNEYFIADMLGMKVVTDEGLELGVLKDVLETGANDVYIVEMNASSADNTENIEGNGNKKEVLIPAIKQCILDIDIENQIMKVHLMKGLLD